MGSPRDCGIIRGEAMYRLVFQNRGTLKEPVVVELPSLVIGRDASCHVQLSEPGVCGRHAAIERHADGYYLHDLDSIGGVFVNGRPVREQHLASGDGLEIGGVPLRFEIVHGIGNEKRRRSIDLAQVLAAAVVLLVIGGQVALLSSMFSENRPKKVKLELALVTRPDPAVSEAVTPTTPTSNEPRPPAEVAGPVQPVPEPAVLNRMIRLARVDRNESGGAVSITIQAKAQVGERELNTATVAICIQFAALGGTGSSVVWRDPIWLPIPQWENFTTKTFTVRFPGASREFVGFVVRTYFRKQMQDIAAVPTTLRPLAPNPSLGGAS